MTLFTPFHKWVTEEHKLFTESVQKFYNDEMKPNIEDWVDNGVVSKSFWERLSCFELWMSLSFSFNFISILLESTFTDLSN